MLSRPLCSHGTSEPGHPAQAFGEEFDASGLLPLMVVVQVLSLLVLFVIIWYSLNYNGTVWGSLGTKGLELARVG